MSEGEERTYGCGPGARWLPRVLAGAVLVSGWLAVSRIAPDSPVPGARSVRGLVVVAAAVAALWLVRKGGEVRLRVRVTTEGLAFEHRGRGALLHFEELEAARYEAPFGATRAWLPAAVLVDERGREWRLCALLEGGERLVEELVERSGRSDLAAWVEAQRIGEKMARSTMRVRTGYALAAALVLAAAAYALH